MTRALLASATALGAVLFGASGSDGPAAAQSSDPYIGAIDDRPAARLRRNRDARANPVNRASTVNPPRTAARIAPPAPVAAARPPGGPDMVVVMPGSFTMGSPLYMPKRDRNEGPQIPVNIDYAFEIGRYEVTFAEWDACVKDGGCNGYRPEDNGWGRGKRPVTNVSYNDAQSYIRWLNAKTGLTYRLPSEAEWEYVARAGSEWPFSTATARGISSHEANFNGKFPYGLGTVPGDYKRQTVPVGSYPANGFGVHDIHGNVYEFVADCYVRRHTGNPGDGSPRRDGDCDASIIRGGSWVTHGYQMRAAKRLQYTREHRYDDFGFRLARTIE
ncbi:MAG: formylglycine-generating enzyme family protein [Pseudomonadota bacterium]